MLLQYVFFSGCYRRIRVTACKSICRCHALVGPPPLSQVVHTRSLSCTDAQTSYIHINTSIYSFGIYKFTLYIYIYIYLLLFLKMPFSRGRNFHDATQTNRRVVINCLGAFVVFENIFCETIHLRGWVAASFSPSHPLVFTSFFLSFDQCIRTHTYTQIYTYIFTIIVWR